jgi:hypothetical protein
LENLAHWNEKRSLMDAVQLNDAPDRVKWKIGSSGKFKVKDLYLQMR